MDTEGDAFALGALAMVILFAVFFAGRMTGCIDTEKEFRDEAKICGPDRIECYQRVLGMEEANE